MPRYILHNRASGRPRWIIEFESEGEGASFTEYKATKDPRTCELEERGPHLNYSDVTRSWRAEPVDPPPVAAPSLADDPYVDDEFYVATS